MVDTTTAREEHLAELTTDMWFIATRDSRKVAHLRANPTSTTTVTASSSWASLSGTAVVDNFDRLKDVWSTFAEAWLPGGPEDPNAILVHVGVDTAEYWDNPGGRVSSLISLAKSKATGKPYNGGENEVVTDL